MVPPRFPANFCPMKVAVFTAMTPGGALADGEVVGELLLSGPVLLSTTSRWRMGSMA